MHNNDILRRIRFTFDFGDDKIIKIFSLGDLEVDREKISNWLKKDDDPDFKSIYDKQLASFLNGFISLKRGVREGPKMKAEKTLNNNIILRKLKIALNLRDEDIVEILQSTDLKFSKHEINAFFRKPTQKQFRHCLDQVLRNFLLGMQMKYRPEA